jgi:hypothetical protein
LSCLRTSTTLSLTTLLLYQQTVKYKFAYNDSIKAKINFKVIIGKSTRA